MKILGQAACTHTGVQYVCVCVCVYVCMYVCIYVCVCMYVCACPHKVGPQFPFLVPSRAKSHNFILGTKIDVFHVTTPTVK